jgi:hypothetical protein
MAEHIYEEEDNGEDNDALNATAETAAVADAPAEPEERPSEDATMEEAPKDSENENVTPASKIRSSLSKPIADEDLE